MKRIVIVALVFSASNITNVYANEIARTTSQRGVTQAQWEATDQYKSFVCPTGSSRGMGVDMNFTTDRSDDTWFATCSIREVVTPKPIIDTPTITVMPIKIDTTTMQVQAPTITQTAPVVNSTSTVTPIIDTQTASVIIPTIAETVTASVATAPTIKKVIKKVIKKKGKK
jgi:hypothetical protein